MIQFSHHRKLAVVTAIASLCSSFLPLALAQQTSTLTGPTYDVLFTVPKGGDKGVTYMYENTPEMLPQGPKRLLIADDGTFLIFDTAAHRLLRYDQAGTYLNTITLPSGSLTDAIVYQGELYAVGVDTELKLFTLSTDGKVKDVTKVNMPKSKGMQVVNELKLDDTGNLVLEITDSDLRSTVDVPLLSMDEKGNAKKAHKFKSVKLLSKEKRKAEVEVDGKVTDTIPFTTNTHALKKFAAQDTGSFQVETTEVMLNPGIAVDTVIRSYGADGKLAGMMRAPASENYINVAKQTTAATDSTLYSLITQPDGAKVVKLKLQPSVNPVLSEPEEQVTAMGTAAEEVGIARMAKVALAGEWRKFLPRGVVKGEKMIAFDYCGSSAYPWRYRSEMKISANAYIMNSKKLTTKNMDINNARCGGTTSVRIVPKQFANKTIDTYYSSVPYLWGGWDLPSAFNAAMDANKVAGNTNTSYPYCSGTSLAGVDCSGLISRMWNLSTKHSTKSLSTASNQLTSATQLKTGDILNKYNDHVRAFESLKWKDLYNIEGIYVWESTVDSTTSPSSYGNGVSWPGQFDGVVYRYLPWSKFGSLNPNYWNKDTSSYMAYSYKCAR